MVDKVENAAGYFWIDEDGLIRCTVKAVHQTPEVAQDSLRIFRELAAGRPRPTVIDTTAVKSLSKEVRAVYTGPGAADVFGAVALVSGGSALVRGLINFVISVGKPPFPTRLFDTLEEAVSWARTQRRAE
jgi:hypothetical protein